MNVEIEEITQDVYEVTLSQYDPDLLALAVRAEDAADSAEDARDMAAQSAADALADANRAEAAAQALENTIELEDVLRGFSGFDPSKKQTFTNDLDTFIWEDNA